MPPISASRCRIRPHPPIYLDNRGGLLFRNHHGRPIWPKIMLEMSMDWTDCVEIEQVPGRLSGVPVLKRSRVRPSDLLLNIGEGPEWLAEAHQIPVEQLKAVLAFYTKHQTQLAPAV